MNAIATLFVLGCCAALLVVPRRWAPLPLLVGTLYVPFYLGLQFGPFHFTAIRMLVVVGAIRVLTRKEWPAGRLSPLDYAVIIWGVWLVITAPFHEARTSPFVFRLGLLYDAFGLYFLLRAFCHSQQDALRIAQQASFLLAPIALEMLYESFTAHNLFSVMGGVDDNSMIREGRVRANGSFGHPILAGTVGAIFLPLIAGLWRTDRTKALLGLVSCITIVITSASSGPVLSAAAGLFGLYMWRYRHKMRTVRWLAVFGYIGLEIVMKDPAYFIIARIDLAGGSTSWYRARLIQSAIEHLNEWWLVGTDYTRHWMWVVVSWSPDHTDITSQYIQMGIWGGLPLIVLFVLIFARAYGAVGKTVADLAPKDPQQAFAVWTLGCSLFVITVTGFSVSFFDQSITLVWMVLATIGSATWTAVAQPETADRKASAGVQRNVNPAGRAASWNPSRRRPLGRKS